MKKYSVIMIIIFLTLNSAWAKLRNGYEKNIHHVREQLKNYNEILNTSNNLSTSERRRIKATINTLIAQQSYYELTEELLAQFKLISPGLYNRIDSMKDANGIPTDIYVKFIPREEASVMAAGITYMAQSDEDKEACFSEYGKHSVSIKVWLFSKALFALSHEFGHVNYQVPNFETYTEYYKKEYSSGLTEPTRMGHSTEDLSGRNAAAFEKEFKRDYLNYIRFRKGDSRLESPLVVMQEIKRKVNNSREYVM
ncbi:hypothetical protein [Chryseolinea sp. H1M3-3]|uniref:hypothetical protein n=1 Tax=Chryseolinea sp. H1M3-3 TaxID=3034144 RepID=UPI0023ECF5CE|nr:hypothetical protein [Chryseolinea sp. H1M3-3]